MLTTTTLAASFSSNCWPASATDRCTSNSYLRWVIVLMVTLITRISSFASSISFACWSSIESNTSIVRSQAGHTNQRLPVTLHDSDCDVAVTANDCVWPVQSLHQFLQSVLWCCWLWLPHLIANRASNCCLWLNTKHQHDRHWLVHIFLSLSDARWTAY